MRNASGLYAAMCALQDLARADNQHAVSAALKGEESPVGENGSCVGLKRAASSGGVVAAEVPSAVGDVDSAGGKQKKEEDVLNSEELMMQEAQELPPVPFSRIWKMQKGQELSLLLGSIFAVSGGCIQPVFSLVYADIIVGFFEPEPEKLRQQSRKFLGYFLFLGLAAFVSVCGRVSLFNRAGEQLTRRLRLASFEASLRQTMSFYDEPKNSVGRLATRLARQTRPSRRSKSAATIQMTQQQQDDDDSSLDGARNKRRRRSPAGARASPTSSRKTREPRRPPSRVASVQNRQTPEHGLQGHRPAARRRRRRPPEPRHALRGGRPHGASLPAGRGRLDGRGGRVCCFP